MCRSNAVAEGIVEPVAGDEHRAAPLEFDPAKLRVAVFNSFAKVVMRACDRMAMAQEQSVFRDDLDAKTTLALVNLAPGLIDTLADAEQEQQKQKLAEAQAPPTPNNCPECFICGASAGKHWTHDCRHLDAGDAEEVLFDYKTRSMYYRKDLGQPMPRIHVPIERNVREWLDHNMLTQEQYAANVDLREMKREAERALHSANCAVAGAARGNFIDAKMAAGCAKFVAETALDMLRHCNPRFNPFLPESNPTNPTDPTNPNPKEESDDSQNPAQCADDNVPHDPK